MDEINNEEQYICRYCGRICKNTNSLRNHEHLCKENPNRQIIKSNFIEYNKRKHEGIISAWNKGLTKETDERVAKAANTLKNGYKTGKYKYVYPYTEEGIKRWKNGCKRGGGYRKNAGHSKKGWYKGIWCDSSWELAFLIYHLDHNLSIKRCTDERTYIYNEKNI